MATVFRLNPESLARIEAQGWRAYYEHKWLKMLQLIVVLCQEQFHIPFPISLLAAYYTTRASILWVPARHDLQKIRSNLEKFYHIARRYSRLTFDPARAAALELRYYDDHRRLIGNDDKSALVQTFAELHSVLFSLSVEQMRESAEWRTQATNTVDLITGKTSTDVEGDWAKLEEYLRQCYRSIQRQLEQPLPLAESLDTP